MNSAQAKATDRYQKANIRRVTVKINRKTEPDMNEWCDRQENLQGKIKELIKKEMSR